MVCYYLPRGSDQLKILHVLGGFELGFLLTESIYTYNSYAMITIYNTYREMILVMAPIGIMATHNISVIRQILVITYGLLVAHHYMYVLHYTLCGANMPILNSQCLLQGIFTFEHFKTLSKYVLELNIHTLPFFFKDIWVYSIN
jgi:hypothetical protein